MRVDIEDRNFHSETKRNGGADYHFSVQHAGPLDETESALHSRPRETGSCACSATAAIYHPQPEWCENIPHPVEQTRGQTGSGDAYSPGWFELPLAKGRERDARRLRGHGRSRREEIQSSSARESANRKLTNQSSRRLTHLGSNSCAPRRQFVVRRDDGKTVIAGYPWFLDWGRDSLICARGLLAAGMVDEVKQLLAHVRANLKKTARCRTRFTARTLPTATPPMRRCGLPSCAKNWRRISRRRTFINTHSGRQPAARIARRACRSIAENYMQRHAQWHPHGCRFRA